MKDSTKDLIIKIIISCIIGFIIGHLDSGLRRCEKRITELENQVIELTNRENKSNE